MKSFLQFLLHVFGFAPTDHADLEAQVWWCWGEPLSLFLLNADTSPSVLKFLVWIGGERRSTTDSCGMPLRLHRGVKREKPHGKHRRGEQETVLVRHEGARGRRMLGLLFSMDGTSHGGVGAPIFSTTTLNESKSIWS